jgi:hypothetical protein
VVITNHTYFTKLNNQANLFPAWSSVHYGL